MTKNEFKAWFDGFCEGMDGAPNEKQWDRIKARVAEIDDKPIPYPVYVDRYVAPVRRWYDYPAWGQPYIAGSVGQGMVNDVAPLKAMLSSGVGGDGTAHSQTFDSHSAMKDAGRAEYRAALNS